MNKQTLLAQINSKLSKTIAIIDHHAKKELLKKISSTLDHAIKTIDDKWITVNGGSKKDGEGGGSHILLDDNGHIKAGAGGKFNGLKVNELSKKEESKLAYNIAEKAKEKHGKGSIKEYLRGGAKEQAKQYLETQKLLGKTSASTKKQEFSKDGLGKTNKVKTAKGTEIETRFKIIDASDLIASHDKHGNTNPKFPQELQPRDRSKLTSQAWVQKTAKNLDIDSLGKTRRADSGAPIIGNDNIVESGNGRSMAIIEAYNSGHADEYKQWLQSEAADFGIDPEIIKGIKNPVLVRQRITDIDRATFTKEANEDDKLAMTATEKAKSDAVKLDYSLVSKLNNDGDLTSVANKDFINGFLNTLSDSERAQYYTTSGQITKQAYDRVQSAIFSKAYNNDRLLELMADDSKPEIKNIISALNSSASQFIKAQELSKKEHRKLTNTIADGVDLSLDEQAINTLVDATNAIMESKNKGLTLEEYLAQTDVFGEGIKPEVAEMALFVKENNRSSAKLATAFKEMANMVNQELENKQNESLFGDDEPINLVDIVKAARNSIKKQDIIEQPKTKGGFIDMFTETRGQKQDREKWLQNNKQQP